MPANFRHFKAGPDLAGRSWQVDLMWMQTAIAIRHSDSLDVKFLLSSGGDHMERVVSLRHPDLLELSRATRQPLTDSWCCRLAARHLRHMVETGEDFEKVLVTVPAPVLARYGGEPAGS